MTFEVRPDLPAAPIGSSQAPAAAGDNPARFSNHQKSNFQSKKAVPLGETTSLPRRNGQVMLLLDKLIRLREEAGISQASLAHQLGITQSQLSKFERGERALDVIRLRDWLRILDVKFKVFVSALDQELNDTTSYRS